MAADPVGNRGQIEYWNGPAAERWVRHQAVFDRGLGPFGRAALERLSPQPGERILDVGCGSGATLLELSARVGSAGRVVGIDPSRPLLEVARNRTRAAVNVELVEADAATHAFAAPFDALFSRFGVMFFVDPVRAFSHLKGALGPGGRLGFACWQSLADNPWCALPLAAARQVLGELPAPPDPYAPGPFAFADPEHVRRILSGAGFSRVELDSFRVPVLMSDEGLDDGVEFALRVGPVSRLFTDLPEATREAVRHAVRRAFAPLVTGSQVALDGAAWLITARS